MPFPTGPLPRPLFSFMAPREDLQCGNDIYGMVRGYERWSASGIVDVHVIFFSESAYATGNSAAQSADAATRILLANNSLHYGRTADIERLFVAYDEDGTTPLGIGFGSYSGLQSWHNGLGFKITIPNWIPTVGGTTIETFDDDQALSDRIAPEARQIRGMWLYPWSTLSFTATAAGTMPIVYVNTPNHLMSARNSNPEKELAGQCFGEGRFQVVQNVDVGRSDEVAERLARSLPDQSDPILKEAIRILAKTTSGKDYLF